MKAWALSVQLSSFLLPLPELTSLLLAWQCGTCANWLGRLYASLLMISYVLWSLSSARADLQRHSSKPCAAPSTCVHWGSPLKPGPCLKEMVCVWAPTVPATRWKHPFVPYGALHLILFHSCAVRALLAWRSTLLSALKSNSLRGLLWKLMYETRR